MASATKEVIQSFDCLVTSVAMDDRFIIVGQEDGHVAAFWWNGGLLFEEQISDTVITAVCCEQQDSGSNHIFYAADHDGRLYTLDKKGKIIAQGQGRDERIHTLLNTDKFGITAYSNTGWTSFENATKEKRKLNLKKEIKASESSTETANYSLDGDGTLYFEDRGGQYHVNQYNCSSASTAIATCAMTFDNDDDVYAYAVVDPAFFDDLDTAGSSNLPVYDSNIELLCTLVFGCPVIQVMSCRMQTTYSSDDIFFLLRNNTIVRMKGNDIENTDILTEDLMTMAEEYIIDVEDDDFIKGFAVHGSETGFKLCFHGVMDIFTMFIHDQEGEI